MLAESSLHIPLALRSPWAIAGYVVGLAAIAIFASRSMKRKQPSAEEMERGRREYLEVSGRLVDGTITDAHWSHDGPNSTPETLIYQYSIGGVTYECGQDVIPLTEHVRHVRIDLPVQVRFDPRNPGDSIVVAEGWSGLRESRDTLESTSYSEIS